MEKEYYTQAEAAEYLQTTGRKIGLYRKYKLIKYAKLGKKYLYKKAWLDEFMEDWSGYDLSNLDKIYTALALKEWRTNRHGKTDGK